MNKMSLRGSQKSQQGYDFLHAANDSRPMHVLIHEFIQNVVFAAFPQDNDLQIERLDLAVRLYQSIGFKRKAAFYKRFAALKYVAAHLKNPDWQACYNSLLESLDGYGLTLDPIEYDKRLHSKTGSFWPGVHLQLLEELITCCKKLQTDTLAIRHMSFILHSLDYYLSSQRKKELAERLELFSARCGEDSPVQITLSNGFVVPNVNLTKFPLCTHFEPLSLPMPLRPLPLTPHRRASHVSSSPNLKDENPFIFTPFGNKYNQSLPKRTLSNSVIADFKWVQDEPCSTMIMFKNTLPLELNVTSIKLLTDGVPFESSPKSLRLDPDPNMSVTVHLTGIPKFAADGSELDRSSSKDDSMITRGPMSIKQQNSVNDTKLILSGYSTHLLGVKSDCKIDLLPSLSSDTSRFPNQYIIEVTPTLPRLEFINLTKSTHNNSNEEITINPSPRIEFIPMDQVNKDYVVMIYSMKVKRGDKQNLVIPLKNADDSTVDIGYISLILVGDKLRSVQSKSCIIQPNQQPQDNSCDTTKINHSKNICEVNLVSWDIDMIEKSLPVRIGQQTEIELMIDTTSEIVADETPVKSANYEQQPHSLSLCSSLTATVIFEYSGGRALASGYCRKSAIKFNIELLDG